MVNKIVYENYSLFFQFKNVSNSNLTNDLSRHLIYLQFYMYTDHFV